MCEHQNKARLQREQENGEGTHRRREKKTLDFLPPHPPILQRNLGSKHSDKSQIMTKQTFRGLALRRHFPIRLRR